ncbi:hypothetical protein [Treponema pectinovorum]|uniref:hypothetical protein n=1 Tax=Treponema pectinovorum TaxID=164 RepID=UPI0011CABCBE|nr:hypothetical protein [Treponema pectinovorum]
MKFFKYFFISLLAFQLFSFGCASNQNLSKTETPKTAENPKKATPAAKKATDEYSKSVGKVTVSKDTFEADKAEILNIIEKLKRVMADYDYNAWLLYVNNESKIYWSDPANLKKAQSKLPIKGLKLKNLQDYFKYVFVPSRSGRDITTLRYESESYVKAVQITSNESLDTDEKYTVYYYFNKINGRWYLHLPKIDS